MITPTVGRKVDFFLNGALGYPGITQREQPLDANVVHVWGERMINVAGFDANGEPYKVTSVALLQDDDPVPPTGQCYAAWMPYQKGQAAKAEALEKQVAEKANV